MGRTSGAKIRRLKPEYLFCDQEGLPARGSLRLPSARVVIYEVADPFLARSLAARGAWAVETFAIKEMLQSLHSRHAS